MQFKKRRGSSAVIIGAVVTVIIAAVFLAVGTYVMGEIQSALPTPTDQTANETTQQVWNLAWVTFRILPISLIVLGAGVILVVLIKGFGVGGGIARIVVIRLTPRMPAVI